MTIIKLEFPIFWYETIFMFKTSLLLLNFCLYVYLPKPVSPIISIILGFDKVLQKLLSLQHVTCSVKCEDTRLKTFNLIGENLFGIVNFLLISPAGYTHKIMC